MTRQQIVDGMRKALAEIQQLYTDCDYWNRHHPEEQIDPDPDGQMERLSAALSDSIAREEALVAAGLVPGSEGHSR